YDLRCKSSCRARNPKAQEPGSSNSVHSFLFITNLAHTYYVNRVLTLNYEELKDRRGFLENQVGGAPYGRLCDGGERPIIIAAGQGALAAQAINRGLFEESLENHTVPHCDHPPHLSEGLSPE
ncbi:MAG: hypothetical protein ABIU05_12600, partial [Nitrospirales bacterium]